MIIEMERPQSTEALYIMPERATVNRSPLWALCPGIRPQPHVQWSPALLADPPVCHMHIHNTTLGT